MEYQYKINEKQYSLVFFMDNYEEDREYIEKEIIPTCDYDVMSAIYFTYFEDTVTKIVFTIVWIAGILVIIKISKQIKQNKKQKGE